jgi:hypothetical protein
MEVKPMSYPEAKNYLLSVGVWHRNFRYYNGWSVLSLAQQEFEKRKKTDV